jgi:hypothetical protein
VRATVPELLDRLAEFYDRDRDLIQALESAAQLILWLEL